MAKHVTLIGMMGAGKTSVAPLLASRLDRPVIEVDALIEQQEGMPSASRIFFWMLAGMAALLLLGSVSPIEAQTYTYLDGGYPDKAVPTTLTDSKTGIRYSLEPDGRHISAV